MKTPAALVFALAVPASAFSETAPLQMFPPPNQYWLTSDVHILNASWFSTLFQAEGCAGALENEHSDVRIQVATDAAGKFSWRVDGKRVPLLEQTDAERFMPAHFLGGELIPDTYWIKLADWVTLQIEIAKLPDGSRKMYVGLNRLVTETTLVPILEATLR